MTAAGRTEGRVERCLHGQVIELTKLVVEGISDPERLDAHVEALEELVPDAGDGADHVERAIARVREVRRAAEST